MFVNHTRKHRPKSPPATLKPWTPAHIAKDWRIPDDQLPIPVPEVYRVAAELVDKWARVGSWYPAWEPINEAVIKVAKQEMLPGWGPDSLESLRSLYRGHFTAVFSSDSPSHELYVKVTNWGSLQDGTCDTLSCWPYDENNRSVNSPMFRSREHLKTALCLTADIVENP
jgi:hypothetical protein